LAYFMLSPTAMSRERRPMPIQRQCGVEIGIGAQAAAPACFKIGYLAAVATLLCMTRPACRRFFVDQNGGGFEQGGPTAFGQAQAEIDVAELDRKVLRVETADGVELRRRRKTIESTWVRAFAAV
jgi:hypothetical protein